MDLRLRVPNNHNDYLVSTDKNPDNYLVTHHGYLKNNSVEDPQLASSTCFDFQGCFIFFVACIEAFFAN